MFSLNFSVHKDRVSELEDTISTIELELTERRNEAAEAIAQWEAHCGAVEKRAEELENDLQVAAKERDEVKLSMERSLVSLRVDLAGDSMIAPYFLWLIIFLTCVPGAAWRTTRGRKGRTLES